jgi:hypothetical protein
LKQLWQAHDSLGCNKESVYKAWDVLGSLSVANNKDWSGLMQQYDVDFYY